MASSSSSSGEAIRASQSLRAAGIDSSETLIRALKAKDDPPYTITGTETCTKVELASLAWTASKEPTVFYLPRRTAFISDWVLESLSKNYKATSASTETTPRAKQRGRDAESSSDYWECWRLLGSIVEDENASLRGSLSSLASKHGAIPILQNLSKQFAELGSRSILHSASSRSLRQVIRIVIAPALQRSAITATDTFYACLHCWVEVLPGISEDSHSFSIVSEVIERLLAAWRVNLGNQMLRRKGHTACQGALLEPLCLAIDVLQIPQTPDMTVQRWQLRKILLSFLVEGLMSSERGPTPSSSPLVPLEILLRSTADSSLRRAALNVVPALVSQGVSNFRRQRVPTSKAVDLGAGSASASSQFLDGSQDSQGSVRKLIFTNLVEPAISLLRDAVLIDEELGTLCTSILEAILETVDQQKLYISQTPDAHIWLPTWSMLAEWLSDSLRPLSGPALFDSLTILWRLEESVLQPLLISVLIQLARISNSILASAGSASSALELYTAIIDNFAKRTEIPALMELIARALAEASSASTDPSTSASSFLLSRKAKTILGRACRSFISPLQLTSLLQPFCSRLETAITENFEQAAEPQESPRRAKRRRTDQESSGLHDQLCFTIAADLHLLTLLAENLTLTGSNAAEVMTALDSAIHSASKLVKNIVEADQTAPPHSPYLQHLVATLLRLSYTIQQRIQQVSSVDQETLQLIETLRSCYITDLPTICQARLRSQAPEPELFVELLRCWFFDQSTSTETTTWEKSNHSALHDRLCDELSKLQSADLTIAPWNGILPGLSADHLPLALLQLITSRWLPFLDSHMESKVARALAVQLFDGFQQLLLAKPGITSSICQDLIQDASFRELDGWAEHFSTLVMANTDSLKGQSIPLREQKSVTTALNSLVAISAFPVDYLDSEVHEELLHRCLKLDEYLGRQQELTEGSNSAVSPSSWMILRRYAVRLAVALSASSGTLSVSSPQVSNMTNPRRLPRSASQQFHETTIYLIAALTLLGLASSQGWTAALVASLAGSNEGTFTGSAEVAALEAVITWVEGDPKSRSLPEPIRQSIEEFTDSIDLQHVKSIIERFAREPTESMGISLARSLKRVYLAKRAQRVVIPSRTTNVYINTIFPALIGLCPIVGSKEQSTSPPGGLHTGPLVQDIAAIILSGPQNYSEGEMGQVILLSVLLMTSVASLEADGVVEELDRFFQLCGKTQYETCLQTLARAANSDVDADDITGILKVLSVAIKSGPEGTSQIARDALGLLLLEMTTGLSDSPNTTLGQLNVARSVIHGRALILQHTDVELLLTYLASLVGPSNRSIRATPDSGNVGSQIFASITSILAGLIRLRQDLLLAFLPHLTMLLSHLMQCFRKLPDDATGAEIRALKSAMPSWLAVHSHPIGVGEARDFARLLSSIVAKSSTLSLGFHSRKSSGTSRTESLSKPFARHSIYVLLAYVHTVVAQDSFVPLSVRKELLPGMFALCDLVSNHERDAAMVGLRNDAAKVVFKGLWGEWEKQRYHGE